MVSTSGREGRIRRSWRLTGVAWDLIREHREMQALAFLGVFFATAASILILYAGGYFDYEEATGPRTVAAALLAAYVSTLISVFFNVALAVAADDAMEGDQMTLREALAEARERFPSIAFWSLIAVVVGFVINAIVSRLPAGGRIVAALAGIAWSLATIFVVPVMALEDARPFTAMGRSIGIVKERWGEGISGNLTIAAWLVLFTLPACLGIGVGLAIADGDPATGLMIAATGFIVLIMASVVASAVRQVFAVALYRYSMGEAGGGFAASDLESPFELRGKSSIKHSRIWGWLAAAVTIMILLGMIGGLAGRHRTGSQVTPPVDATFSATFPPEAKSMVSAGMLVQWHGHTVGHVSQLTDTGSGVTAYVAIDPAWVKRVYDPNGGVVIHQGQDGTGNTLNMADGPSP